MRQRSAYTVQSRAVRLAPLCAAPRLETLFTPDVLTLLAVAEMLTPAMEVVEEAEPQEPAPTLLAQSPDTSVVMFEEMEQTKRDCTSTSC